MGDVVLFLKSEKEYDKHYQYDIVKEANCGRDGQVRDVIVEYQNAVENVKRCTHRGVRDLVAVHCVDEIGINLELGSIANECGDAANKVSLND